MLGDVWGCRRRGLEEVLGEEEGGKSEERG